MNINKNTISHLITEGLVWPAQATQTAQRLPATEPTLIGPNCSIRKFNSKEVNNARGKNIEENNFGESNFGGKTSPAEEATTYRFNYPPLDSLLEGGLSCGKLHEWIIPAKSTNEPLSFPPLIIILYLMRNGGPQKNDYSQKNGHSQTTEKHLNRISNIWIGRELWPTSFWLEKLNPNSSASSDIPLAKNIFLAPQSNRDLQAAITQGLSSSDSIVVFSHANPSFALTRKWHLAARRSGSTAFFIRPCKINSELSLNKNSKHTSFSSPQLPASCAATRWLVEPLQNENDTAWLVSLVKSKGLIKPERFTLTWGYYENTFSFSLYPAHTGRLDSREITEHKKHWKKVS